MPYDRAEDDHRGLCYDTELLSQDLEIVGSPEAVISLSADQPDFPLHVALCDVAPDGRSTLICQGWGNAARLAGQPLQPGETYAITIGLHATSSRVPLGHRLRLVIAGADFPLLWPAPRNPTLAVARGPEQGTVLRVPLAPPPDAEQPVPAFGPPPVDTATAWDNRHDRIGRDLSGATAWFDQGSRQRLTLQDGSPLSLLEQNLSTISGSRPEDTVMQCHLEADLDRPGDPLRAVVDTVQTQEAFHVEASISLAGRLFYHRSWDLRLTSN
jgi:hypothetical protein